MSKKFWRRSPVSKLLKAPKEALKKSFLGGSGRGVDAESLLKRLPDLLPGVDRGLEVLDQGFPIREGASRIDGLARGSDGELIFLWLKPHLNAETVSKILPDYDWVQKNQALWPHLFPEFLQQRSLRMKVWLLSFRIDPEIHCFLSYLNGIQLKLWLARRGQKDEHASWVLSPWEQKSARPQSLLPSSPSVLSLVPPPTATPEPGPQKWAPPLLSQEEINDLMAPPSQGQAWQPDEVTDPYYVIQREGH